MRAVIQRVKSASVEVDGELISRIGPGLLCLIGIKDGDTLEDADFIIKKILKTRAFHHVGTNKPWDQTVADIDGEVLCVSQFTLYGRLKKPRPDYSKAMPPQQAREFYDAFLERLRGSYMPERVKDGAFGAYMNVALENDGPVTYILDSETDR